MIVIGLDISTSTIGYSVLKKTKNKIKLIERNHYKPLTENDGYTISERLYETKEFFRNIFKKYKPDYLAVEEYIQFIKGASGAKTTIPLAIFNRTLCLLYYEMYRKNPYIINVNTIRKIIKINDTPKKEDIPDVISKHLNIKFKFKTKINKKTKKEKIITENYDEAD